jgi:hypothetical protein
VREHLAEGRPSPRGQRDEQGLSIGRTMIENGFQKSAWVIPCISQ